MISFYFLMMMQIVLESFPISSSGHCFLFEQIFHGYQLPVVVNNFRSYIIYLLHVPTILVICIYFFKEWSFPFTHIKRSWPIVLKIIFYTAIADMITICFYVLKQYYEVYLPLSIGFIFTALMLYSLRWCDDAVCARWTLSRSIVLGFAQSIAFLPGISRLGITFVVARWMGIASRRAFQIALLIHFPLMIISSCYALYALGPLTTELLNLISLSVMLGAGIIAYMGISLVGYMVKRHIMWLWSIYMLVPIVISILWEV
jgi:undecaprenyl-diphosphatase